MSQPPSPDPQLQNYLARAAWLIKDIRLVLNARTDSTSACLVCQIDEYFSEVYSWLNGFLNKTTSTVTTPSFVAVVVTPGDVWKAPPPTSFSIASDTPASGTDESEARESPKSSASAPLSVEVSSVSSNGWPGKPTLSGDGASPPNRTKPYVDFF